MLSFLQTHLMWSFSYISLIWLYRVQVVHIRGKGKIEQERNLSSWRSFNRFRILDGQIDFSHLESPWRLCLDVLWLHLPWYHGQGGISLNGCWEQPWWFPALVLVARKTTVDWFYRPYLLELAPPGTPSEEKILLLKVKEVDKQYFWKKSKSNIK